MTIRSVELTAIEAKRFSKPNEKVGQIRIDHNSTVTLVTPKGEGEASVEFRYTASYGGVGIIKMEGTLNYQGDAENLASQWQQTNQMPGNVASEIHTAVMRVCVPEAVGIAKNLNLPPPIPLPQVKFQQGQGGPAAQQPVGPEFG